MFTRMNDFDFRIILQLKS